MTSPDTARVVWLAALDLAAGTYLRGYAVRRERRDKETVPAQRRHHAGARVVIAGLAAWKATQELPEPLPVEASLRVT